MPEISKLMNKTNTSYRELGSGDAKNTDLFFDREHRDFFGDNPTITVRLEKKNIAQSFLFIASMLPKKFDSSSVHEKRYYSDDFVDDGLRRVNAVFGENPYRDFTWSVRKDVPMKNGQIDERLYLNDLLSDHEYTDKNGRVVRFKFTIRDYLLGGYSTLRLIKEDGAEIIKLFIVNSSTPHFTDEAPSSQPATGVIMGSNTIQTIYYGCPGTGKSHQVKDLTEGLDNEKIIKFDDGTINVFRTTFHPDYDYSTFVGCYKPVKENGVLDYKFVPQVFTNAYVTAKKHPDTPIYLIIEEINRGNCAQIFGDLFQLLDRENGESKFPIDAEEELMKYLRDEAQLDEYIKIKLPANFNIYATMNTSDQSLFPMDSAFKRRWEMKYIKIDYTNQEADYTFKVNGADYHWLEYLPCINDKITLATDSEDKQMGEFFIRSNMSATEFKNKVMFYLWNDVCKDLYSGKNSPQSFFFRDIYGNPFKFTELFNEPAPDASEEDKKDPRKNGDLLLEGFLYYVKNGKKKAPKTEAITEQTVEEPEEGGEQTAE